jgi:hypothetical protein
VRKVVPRVGDSDRLEFAYTIGLTALDHPEVVIYGLPAEAAHEFLNDIGSRVQAGSRFTADRIATDLAEDDLPMAFIAVLDTADLTAVDEIYGAVDALQMVWPDHNGRFPWAEGYSLAADVQPLKGVWRGPS